MMLNKYAVPTYGMQASIYGISSVGSTCLLAASFSLFLYFVIINSYKKNWINIKIIIKRMIRTWQQKPGSYSYIKFGGSENCKRAQSDFDSFVVTNYYNCLFNHLV